MLASNPVEDLISDSRLSFVASERSVLMAIAVILYRMTFEASGSLFNRHYSTAIHAKNTVIDRLDVGDYATTNCVIRILKQAIVLEGITLDTLQPETVKLWDTIIKRRG